MKRLSIIIFLTLISLAMFAGVTPAVIKIYDESEIDSLINEGISIERRRGNILLCYLPYSNDSDVRVENNLRKVPSKGKGIQKKRDKIITPTLDEAIKFLDAYKIQEGNSQLRPYTGNGVVVGLCDIGLDPLHPTFLDENGKSRIKRITHYNEYEGTRLELEGDEEYAQWETDTDYNYHATHVAGILAGRGAESPYVGIATGADIVASLSCLTDFGLLMGVEDIIDYAKQVEKPAVINLSVGSYTGAHDGTSLFSQYLDLCADDAIIVISAGNEGKRTNTLSYTFTENSKPLEFRLGNRAWDQKSMYGITDIWNSNDKPITVTICIFDDEDHNVVYQYEPVTLDNWEEIIYHWEPDNPIIEGLSLDGFLIVTGGTDPENGRYEVGLIYDYESSRLIGTGWAKDMISVKITGESGDEIDIFADGTYTRLMPISGNPSPDSHLSISDLACGFRTISVGMYGNRSEFPVSVINDTEMNTGIEFKNSGYQPFYTVEHSSYGTLNDGRVLPLTTGPGIPVVSAMSRYYLMANPGAENYLFDENNIPWLATGGTSMSAPYVAGYISTWLEAIPDLKPEDIQRVITETNFLDIPEPDNPRNLNGYFNPVAAFRNLLAYNGINNVKDPEKILLPSDNIEVWNASGIKVYSGTLEHFSKPASGIYIISTPYGVIKKLF